MFALPNLNQMNIKPKRTFTLVYGLIVLVLLVTSCQPKHACQRKNPYGKGLRTLRF